MSERKKPRLNRCLMCGNKAVHTRHNKCLDCRIALQMSRYAVAGKLDKFRSPANREQ